jgi:hypothetical protein
VEPKAQPKLHPKVARVVVVRLVKAVHLRLVVVVRLLARVVRHLKNVLLVGNSLRGRCLNPEDICPSDQEASEWLNSAHFRRSSTSTPTVATR